MLSTALLDLATDNSGPSGRFFVNIVTRCPVGSTDHLSWQGYGAQQHYVSHKDDMPITVRDNIHVQQPSGPIAIPILLG